MAMRNFVEELDWTPSYEVPGTFGVDQIAGHMIVEHGLDNAAAISFLRRPARSIDLRTDQLRSLLTISYNNLIEWHLFVSADDARWINNLADRSSSPAADRPIQITPESLSSTVSFPGLTRFGYDDSFSKPIKPCDEALIRTITRWKEFIKADYPSVDSRNLSSLFNSLIFVRGCEDRNLNQTSDTTQVLLSTLTMMSHDDIDFVAVLEHSLSRLEIDTPRAEFVNIDSLQPFRAIDTATAYNLIRDLYKPREAGYEFNFALTSKHALSRIYEKYVALFQQDELEAEYEQLSFISPAPKTIASRRSGSVYTPQFIAGFFARFIRDNLTPKSFRELLSIDPACGSGLFLRTLLELQCDPSLQGTVPSTIR